MDCPFCQARVPGIAEAIVADWIPSWWDGDHKHDTPVCPTCVERRLTLDEPSGEFVLRTLVPMNMDEYATAITTSCSPP